MLNTALDTCHQDLFHYLLSTFVTRVTFLIYLETRTCSTLRTPRLAPNKNLKNLEGKKKAPIFDLQIMIIKSIKCPNTHTWSLSIFDKWQQIPQNLLFKIRILPSEHFQNQNICSAIENLKFTLHTIMMLLGPQCIAFYTYQFFPLKTSACHLWNSREYWTKMVVVVLK